MIKTKLITLISTVILAAFGSIFATTTYAAADDYVWVPNCSSNNVTRIKKSDLTTTTIAVGTNPIGVAVDETWCWVANISDNAVTRIQKSNPAISTTIAVGTGPYGITVDEAYCWVANSNSANVTRIKKSDLTTTTIVVGTGPQEIVVDATCCWVANFGSNNVTRVKKSDLTTTTIEVGANPYGIAVDETHCWVSNFSSNNVTLIKKSDLTTATIAVENGPRGVALDGTWCWVASWCSVLKPDGTYHVTNSGAKVTRITKSTLVTTTITAGITPVGIAVDKTYCWVANCGSNNVTRIKKSDLTTTTIAVGTGPYSLGDMTGYAYDNYSQKVSSSANEPNDGKPITRPADEVIKKIEEQIFYPDEQENLGLADYMLICGPQILMKQFNTKLEYGNKAKAKDKEQGFFKPEALRKKEETKRTDAKNDKSDKARTWPNYDVTMGIWRLADPANLLMQLFIIPLHRTFPEDKWERELQEQDEGYELTFVPKTQRPISGNDPGILIVNSVTLITDKEFVVSKVKLTFDQSFMKSQDQAHPGLGALKFAEDSTVEVTFIKHKDKLLIKELKQVIQSGSPNPAPPMFAVNLTPTYKFEFKEIEGFLLPTLKHIELPGGELSGALGGMEFHFLIEYLEYKVKAKKK